MRNRLIAAVALSALCFACPPAAQVQGTWPTATGNLSTVVELNTQVLLISGSVLVAGGTDGTNYFNTGQLYSPSTGNWKAIGSMATGRDNFAAVVLADGEGLG